MKYSTLEQKASQSMKNFFSTFCYLALSATSVVAQQPPSQPAPHQGAPTIHAPTAAPTPKKTPATPPPSPLDESCPKPEILAQQIHQHMFPLIDSLVSNYQPVREKKRAPHKLVNPANPAIQLPFKLLLTEKKPQVSEEQNTKECWYSLPGSTFPLFKVIIHTSAQTNAPAK
jgi:hypothetical protein